MNKQKTQPPKVFTILRSSINTLVTNSAIVFPFSIILFAQLLILEILYFIPQWPLNVFFGPIISKLWSVTYMHYPFNLALLPKLFYYAQIPAYILLSSFMICVGISAIMKINNDEEVKIGAIFKQLLPSYVYIVVTAVITFFFIKLFVEGYDLVFQRAEAIRSQSGPFYWLKMTIIVGAPYFKVLLNVVGTTLFAYVFPLIVIEKRNVFSAIILNLRYVLTAPIKTFLIVLIPTLLYVLILLSRNHIPFEAQFPEMRVLSIVVSVLVMVFIDAIVYTSITTFYLIRKGQ